MQSFIERLFRKHPGYFNGFWSGLFGVFEDIPTIVAMLSLNSPIVVIIVLVGIGALVF